MKNLQKIHGQRFVWKIKDSDKDAVSSIASNHNVSFPVAQSLYARGLISKEEVNSFLFVSEDSIGDARLLKDSESAVKRILQAIEYKEKVLIFGDYDVDGITSTSLLLVALIPLGAKINYYLPNRLKEGYGLSVDAVRKAKDNGYSLIVTVDNGVTAIEAAKVAKSLGIDLIITDHHRPKEDLPISYALVDPNQSDCKYPNKDLAGVGVIFKLVTLIYEIKNKKLPDKIYELLMLGIVADMVPLYKENRFWVRHGLKSLNDRKSFSIKVLEGNVNLKKGALTSLDIGFMIAPQINALGRLDDPREAVKFLISSSVNDVRMIGEKLKMMNEERKSVERKISDEIETLLLKKIIDISKENVIMASNADWPSGVIGLAAGKFSRNYGKPTFLFHEKAKGILAGSCRSIPEFDIFNALTESKDLLISFGGHSFAAGLSLKKENVTELKERLEEKIRKDLKVDILQPRLDVDAECQLSEMTKKLLEDLENLEPFGNSNEQPNFVFKDLTLLHAPTILKDKHVKCSVFSHGVIKPVIFFNRPDLIPFFNSISDKPFHIAGNVMKNEWNDQVRIEIKGLDVAAVE